MLRLLSSKVQGCKDLWRQSLPCHVGIHWIALIEHSQMSTHVPRFQSNFLGFLHQFELAKLATSSIRVKPLWETIFFYHCWILISRHHTSLHPLTSLFIQPGPANGSIACIREIRVRGLMNGFRNSLNHHFYSLYRNVNPIASHHDNRYIILGTLDSIIGTLECQYIAFSHHRFHLKIIIFHQWLIGCCTA